MVKVITPPAAEPVSLDEFKQWANGLPVTAEQEPIANAILRAGREEAEAYQNAAYCEQTLQLTIEPKPQPPGVPFAATLPRPPFRELKSVIAHMADGTQNDIMAQFEVHNDGGPAKLVLKPGMVLHGLIIRLLITYTAGYDTVPDKVKQAILLYATWAWLHRGGDEPVPAAFYALLSKGRVIPV